MSKRFGEKSTTVLTFYTLLSLIAITVYLPILSPYALSLGASLSLIGLISGSFGFVQLLSRIPIGLLSDRGRQRINFLRLGSICGIISCLGFTLSSQPQSLILWRGLAGIGGATLSVNAALFSAYSSPSNLARAMGLFNLTNSLALAFGPILGGVVAEIFGWNMSFYMGFSIGIVGFILLSALVEPDHSTIIAPVFEKRIISLLRNPVLLQAVTMMFVVGCSEMVTTFTYVPLLAVQLGANQFELGLMVLIAMGMRAYTSFYSGMVLIARLGKQLTYGIGFVLVSLSVFALPYVDSILTLMLAQTISGIGWGLCITVIATSSLESAGAEEHHATAAGLYLTGGSLGMFIGPVIGGFMADHYGLNGVFFLIGSICLLAASWAIIKFYKDPISQDNQAVN